MRGLAMGQRIEVLMTPEVARLVREAMTAASSTDKPLTPLPLELQSSSDPTVFSSALFDTKVTHAGIGAEREGLCQVAAWLVLSGTYAQGFRGVWVRNPHLRARGRAISH